MTKYIFSFFVASLLWLPVLAQYKGMFFELGGSGGFASVNYEKTLWDPQSHRIIKADCSRLPPAKHTYTWRAGFSTIPVDKNNGWVLIFPAMANVVYSIGDINGPHKLEAGAGIALSITTKGSWYIKSPAMIGYRFTRSDKKIFYRVNYTPIIGWLVDYNWQHWAGVSIGYRLE